MAHKLLLADDSITIQKVVELVLAEEDFEIRSVGNGEDAFNELETFRPDIVLADIEMPRMNGYQLCEKIKQDPATSGIPVILLAGAFEPIDEGVAKKVGADDSVIKPFESHELISKINAALTMAPSGGAEEAVLQEEEYSDEEEVLEVIGDEDVAVEADLAGIGEDAEDLWTLEETAGAENEEWAAEAVMEEEQTGTEDAFAVSEEEFIREETEESVLEEETGPRKAAGEPVMREVPMPSSDELREAFEKNVREQLSVLLSSMDVKEMVSSQLVPVMKDSIEKILWEITPDLVEKVLREIMKESVSSIAREVEKVIWETVPDLAGTMISKEIERIKSEY